MQAKKVNNAATLLTAVIMLTGCATHVVERNPLPEKLSGQARVLDSDYMRFWGDIPPPFLEQWMEISDADLEKVYGGIMGKEHHYLAISGGGPNGAYGAGVLYGWTQTGKRPEFTIVTGISIGAITAPFAFLGSEYDEQLKEMFTSYSTKDIVQIRSIFKLRDADAFTDTAPLEALIAEYINDDVIAALAEEYKKGRELIIGTTNVDALRPVSWNLTRMAASGHPDAKGLIHKVIMASAALPAAFPPVIIPVKADGKTYDEMHIDGGIVNQVFLYPTGLEWSKVSERLDVQGRPQVYIIHNLKLDAKWETTDAEILPVLARSLRSLIQTQGLGDLYRLYLTAERDGMNFNLTSIPSDFEEEGEEPFDAVYMNKLFDVGYKRATTGNLWNDFSKADAEQLR